MQQVCAEAEKFGIPFCFIEQDNALPNDFLNCKKILISYVQKIFNGMSILGIGNRSIPLGCVVLDDSHACIDSILGSCTINILSDKDSDLYLAIRAMFEDDLKLQGEGSYQDLTQNKYSTFMPIPYWNWYDKSDQVTEMLSRNTDKKNIKFAWEIIKNQIKFCQAYISNSKIEISPTCIPIKTFGSFYKAPHRILMSATTQEDTFFIKGLGLSIDAIINPLIDEEYTWSGEKMILIPSLICENTKTEDIESRLLTANHTKFGIAALTPSFEKAEKYVKYNAVLVNAVGNKIYNIITEFKSQPGGQKLVFANRYDGIDLPDDACRILILDSLPYYDSLADKYEEGCRANSEIIKIKTIQKIEQGLGRSVRGEKDYSVIIVLGNDLIKYLKSENNTKYFSTQTQKQLQIGFEIVEMTKEDQEDQEDTNELKVLFSTINQCLNRNEGWKAYYSSHMDQIKSEQRDRGNLYKILEMEQKAYYECLSEDLIKACSYIQTIVDLTNEDCDKAWYLQLLAKYKYAVSKIDSNELQISAFKKNTEMLRPISGISYKKLMYPVNEIRSTQIITQIMKYPSYSELSLEIEDLLSKLSFGVSASSFEYAVKQLGEMLGFASQRPDKEIRKGPDNLWCSEANKYLLIECKSEVEIGRDSIKKTEAGQMEEHCGWFESEYKIKSYQSIIIIPTTKMAFDAYFSHGTRVMNQKSLNLFKKKIRAFFSEFKKYDFASITTDLVSQWIINHKLVLDMIVADHSENAKYPEMNKCN